MGAEPVTDRGGIGAERTGTRVQDMAEAFTALLDEFKHVAAGGECGDLELNYRTGVPGTAWILDSGDPRRAVRQWPAGATIATKINHETGIGCALEQLAFWEKFKIPAVSAASTQ